MKENLIKFIELQDFLEFRINSYLSLYDKYKNEYFNEADFINGEYLVVSTQENYVVGTYTREIPLKVLEMSEVDFLTFRAEVIKEIEKKKIRLKNNWKRQKRVGGQRIKDLEKELEQLKSIVKIK